MLSAVSTTPPSEGTEREDKRGQESKWHENYYRVALSIFAGAALGATAIQALHAQAKPPVYYIAEINVTNPELYGREYAPKAQAMIKAAGGRFLAAGQNITSFEGEPPKDFGRR